ncbi:hypothetical protein [Natrinema salifodinae]|uniref:Uncharacterized protein n=1 Tax=Natrinema salifodinae TaxID=1202768 RepID=A0A1I0P5M2_9EURY|nr:hypothetical protein [Natrinema salifodinae]SEW09493.1 hypothetical protein SAMN05216285_2161 [Natrinema salifodinae]
MSRGRGPSRGPSRPSEVTDAADQLKIVFVLLVGLSGGSIALQSDASPAVIGGAILGGIIAGGALLWYLIRMTTD